MKTSTCGNREGTPSLALLHTLADRGAAASVSPLSVLVPVLSGGRRPLPLPPVAGRPLRDHPRLEGPHTNITDDLLHRLPTGTSGGGTASKTRDYEIMRGLEAGDTAKTVADMNIEGIIRRRGSPGRTRSGPSWRRPSQDLPKQQRLSLRPSPPLRLSTPPCPRPTWPWRPPRRRPRSRTSLQPR